MNKSKQRRAFLELGIKSSMALPLLASGLYQCTPKPTTQDKTEKEASSNLEILILGGTSFLGPHQIAYALERGHKVSIFTRGKTKPTIHQNLFNQVEHLVGDRNDNLDALKGRKWDAVIDNSGRQAEWTRKSAELLKDNCELYLYTSSTGVFYPYINSEFKESSEVLLTMPETTSEEEKMEYGYGVMKANSENAAIDQFGKDRTIVVRPTYMFGPADRTDRFIHWPVRLSQGGQTLVPGKKTDPVQYADVRDITEWMIKLIEKKEVGTYNAAGPSVPQNILTFVKEAQKSFEVESEFIVIDDYDFLKDHDVHYIVPWIMPTGNNVGSAMINNEKAIKNGLTFRPLTESIKDTYNWWNSDAVTQERRNNLLNNPKSILAREKDIIKAWKAI